MNTICPKTNKPCEITGCGGVLCNHGVNLIPSNVVPQTSYGWECPRCFKIHSPFSLTCDCPPRTFTSGGSTILPITFTTIE